MSNNKVSHESLIEVVRDRMIKKYQEYHGYCDVRTEHLLLLDAEEEVEKYEEGLWSAWFLEKGGVSTPPFSVSASTWHGSC